LAVENKPELDKKVEGGNVHKKDSFDGDSGSASMYDD
jgi:hypothetical protein